MQVYIEPFDWNDLLKDEIEQYIWELNNSEGNKYLELRFHNHTTKSVKEYIENLPDNYKFFRIFREHEWLGNIKLGPINQFHKFGEIGVLIFQRHWKKGYATQAIKLISDYAFDVLHLHKIFAGCLEPNIASIKTFKKAGFNEEYRIKNQYLTNGNGYVDDIVLSKINTQFEGYTKWNIVKDALCPQPDQEQDSIMKEFVKPAPITVKEKVLTGVRS